MATQRNNNNNNNNAINHVLLRAPPQRRHDHVRRHTILAGGGQPQMVVSEQVLRADVGHVSPQLRSREDTSYWGVLWNEFLGTLMYAFVARIFVAIFGGTSAAATIPTLYGTAFTNAFAYFGAMATFGAISGGHFNPAITLAVLLIEFYARWGIFGKFHWKRTRGSETHTRGGKGRRSTTRGLVGEDGLIPFDEDSSPWVSWFGLFPYFAVQFLAFIISALLIWGLLSPNPRPAPVSLGMPIVTNNVSVGKTFGAELLASFLFIAGYLVLLKMFGSTRNWFIHGARSLFFAVWYFALIVAFGFFAGAVWNPSLWFAFALITGRYTNWWALLLPPLIAAVVASVFCVLHWWIGSRNGLQRVLVDNNK